MNLMRLSWGMGAAVWFAVTVLVCVALGPAAVIVALAFGLGPDVALIGAFAERGRLKPTRVRLYNTLHTMTLPIVLLVIGSVTFFITGGIDGGFIYIALAGAAWFVHIAADRAFGFGFRDSDGSIIPVGFVV
ncbi:hypothetical protein GCM10009786_13040 [Leucobacter alluvii]|uniref:DUF4260 family protein n=1 Tax=Leucobacter alluvii TaxID=340321 RepID=A0ABN3B4F5_9MICO